jgi:hypothetical protein
MMTNSFVRKNVPYNSRKTAGALELQQEYAAWFNTANWNWYLTLTFSRERTRDCADALLEEYFNVLEEGLRTPLSCLIAPEQKYSGLGNYACRPHFHILVGCAPTVSAKNFSDIWRQPKFGGSWVVKNRKRCQTPRLPPMPSLMNGSLSTADRNPDSFAVDKAASLNHSFFAEPLSNEAESALVLPYDRSMQAGFYLFKTMGTSDWEWSLRRMHLVFPNLSEGTGMCKRARQSIKRQAARLIASKPQERGRTSAVFGSELQRSRLSLTGVK